ncbi:MAG: PP2C family protein-serine/threonine phosphatase [Aureliella sp.]
MPARIISAGRTDTGKQRSSNQDQFLIGDLHKSMLVEDSSLNLNCQARLYGRSFGRLLMVADGMGGHRAGNRASLLALDLLINQLVNGMRWPTRVSEDEEDRFVADLKQLFETAHKLIVRQSDAHPDMQGMGTTLTMAYIIWPMMYVVHAGDSRCYLMRGNAHEQLTRDHTVSAQLVEESGWLREEAESSRWSHVLYNALGAGGESVTAEVYKVTLQQGDAILLCTDGLYRHVSPEEMSDVLQRDMELGDACRTLIDLANFRGGSDNITVVAARCLPPSPQQKPRTLVATEMTLERVLGGLSGFEPELAEDSSRPIEEVDTAEYTPRQ